MIISSNITTKVNYRKAVPVRSEFYAISQFAEVYHAQGITTLPFSGAERPVTGKGINTTYRRKSS
ncbi:hypothetical protein EKN42_21540 [Enterobacter hormaechei]|nr:hypothetical protein B1023_24760 [Enterobacter hormaechei]RTM48289.1 hypothetical protein EKO10_23040 [Enterobacter hormaechei subsp. xiangfangensis]RTP36662.1 hypothetical protein EKN42_21540 [Enterobacter hormaechei]URL76982.1 hypothetical protein EZJ13_24645 [Enterobacter hormaechei]